MKNHCTKHGAFNDYCRGCAVESMDAMRRVTRSSRAKPVSLDEIPGSDVGLREERPPSDCRPGDTTAIQAVLCRPNEDVEWTYCYGPEGRRVVGYTIVSKPVKTVKT